MRVRLASPRAVHTQNQAVASVTAPKLTPDRPGYAVAYDVDQTALGRGLIAYTRRAAPYSAVIPLLLAHVLAFQLGLLAAGRRHRPRWRDWIRFASFAGGRCGLLRGMVRPGLAYVRPGFHPWNDDNSARGITRLAGLELGQDMRQTIT